MDLRLVACSFLLFATLPSAFASEPASPSIEKKADEIAATISEIRGHRGARDTKGKSLDQLYKQLAQLGVEANALINDEEIPPVLSLKEYKSADLANRLGWNNVYYITSAIFTATAALASLHNRAAAHWAIPVFIANLALVIANESTMRRADREAAPLSFAKKLAFIGDIPLLPFRLVRSRFLRARLSLRSRKFFGALADSLENIGIELQLSNRERKQLAAMKAAVPELVAIDQSAPCSTLLLTPTR
jgi:hypothetical protein